VDGCRVALLQLASHGNLPAELGPRVPRPLRGSVRWGFAAISAAARPVLVESAQGPRGAIRRTLDRSRSRIRSRSWPSGQPRDRRHRGSVDLVLLDPPYPSPSSSRSRGARKAARLLAPPPPSCSTFGRDDRRPLLPVLDSPPHATATPRSAFRRELRNMPTTGSRAAFKEK